MSDGPLFASMDASALQGDLLNLLCKTAQNLGRIEVNCDGGTCVLLSKDELVCLERALEILFQADGGQKIHRSLEDFLTHTLVAE